MVLGFFASDFLLTPKEIFFYLRKVCIQHLLLQKDEYKIDQFKQM